MDGVFMGFPLASLRANIFMGSYKSNWLKKYNLNKHISYLRCVDDILIALDKAQNSLSFLHFLSKRHPNIKFAIETKNKQTKYSFIDVFISGIVYQNITLPTHQKLTYTGILLTLIRMGCLRVVFSGVWSI